MRGDVEGLFTRLFGGQARRYRVSVVTNATPDVAEVVEKDVAPGTTDIHERPLGLAWPRFVFSLSHVALPFPVDDPLYGIVPDVREDYGVRLGQLEPRGERGVLLMPVDDLMRLTCNPFFPIWKSACERGWRREIRLSLGEDSFADRRHRLPIAQRGSQTSFRPSPPRCSPPQSRTSLEALAPRGPCHAYFAWWGGTAPSGSAYASFWLDSSNNPTTKPRTEVN